MTGVWTRVCVTFPALDIHLHRLSAMTPWKAFVGGPARASHPARCASRGRGSEVTKRKACASLLSEQFDLTETRIVAVCENGTAGA